MQQSTVASSSSSWLAAVEPVWRRCASVNNKGYVCIAGYGSLLCPDSARRTCPSLIDFRACRIPGYRRVFNLVSRKWATGQDADCTEIAVVSAEPTMSDNDTAAEPTAGDTAEPASGDVKAVDVKAKNVVSGDEASTTQQPVQKSASRKGIMVGCVFEVPIKEVNAYLLREASYQFAAVDVHDTKVCLFGSALTLLVLSAAQGLLTLALLACLLGWLL